MRLAWRSCRLLALAVLSAAGTGCVEAYDGSWLEFELGPKTQVPSNTDREDGRPPQDTHYEFWVTTGPNSFHLADFQVVKQIDTTFPCFIDVEGTRYPGIHSDRFYTRLLEDALATGDPNTPDEEELGILADADRRMDNQVAVEAALKAVVGWDPAMTPALLAQLATDVGDFSTTDDASNAARLATCQKFFDDHPDYYVGQDKVFSVPLSGHWFGMVRGTDPRNMAPVGGAGFTVPLSFEQFDRLMITWQFNDPNDPRITGTVDGIGPFGPSETGYYYMDGPPQYRTRRTVNVDMASKFFGGINAHIAIFPGINDDGATF